MKIDNNPLEMEAMELFRQKNEKEGWKLQRKFLDQVKESGVDHCPCKVDCPIHGNCEECVVLHRGHGDHLPHCLFKMAKMIYKET